MQAHGPASLRPKKAFGNIDYSGSGHVYYILLLYLLQLARRGLLYIGSARVCPGVELPERDLDAHERGFGGGDEAKLFPVHGIRR